MNENFAASRDRFPEERTVPSSAAHLESGAGEANVASAVGAEPDAADALPESPASRELAAVKDRLNEIVGLVDDEGISLDEALALYEEAVKLGTKATDLLEEQMS